MSNSISKFRWLTATVIVIHSFQAYAQITAVTNTGDPVILYSNGTWKYQNAISAPAELTLNKKKFQVNPSATFKVKSSRISAGVAIDPSKWTFKKTEESVGAEFSFQNNNGDLYGMMISEKLQVPIDLLTKVAFDNARKVSPDIEIKKQEYRIVNGNKLVMMWMEGTIEDIGFTYLGYYYSYEGGTIQFVAYTSSNIFERYQADLENLLNGLVIEN